ncbi:MAG: hypothetical protein QXU79_00260 [Candidatus Micrarchaeaceae archaeon]
MVPYVVERRWFVVEKLHFSAGSVATAVVTEYAEDVWEEVWRIWKEHFPDRSLSYVVRLLLAEGLRALESGEEVLDASETEA